MKDFAVCVRERESVCVCVCVCLHVCVCLAATFLAMAGILAWRNIRKACSGLGKIVNSLFWFHNILIRIVLS